MFSGRCQLVVVRTRLTWHNDLIGKFAKDTLIVALVGAMIWQ